MLYAPTLPFGKHRGQRLSDVPLGYVRWLLNADLAEPWLRRAAKAELARRGERLVPAAAVLADLQDSLEALVSEDEQVPHCFAAILTDHVLTAFDAVRERHGVGDETDLLVPARQDEQPWRRGTP